MKKVALFVICICLSSFLIFSFSISPSLVSLSSKTVSTNLLEKPLLLKTNSDADEVLLRNFTNTGDFIQWYNQSFNWDWLRTYGYTIAGYAYEYNTSYHVYSYQIYRDIPSYNTSCFVTRFISHLSIYTLYSGFTLHIHMKMLYTNGFQWLIDWAQGVQYGYPLTLTNFSVNCSLMSNKIIDKLYLEILLVTNPSYSYNADFGILIYDESYFGRKKVLPTTLSITPSMFRIADPVVFSFKTDIDSFYDGSFPTSDIAGYVTLLYNASGNYKNVQLPPDWTQNLIFSQTLYFNISGRYLVKFFLTSLFFQYITETAWYALKAYGADELIYPAEGKLTLWSPLGLAIPTNLKVYVGNSETFELYMPEINKTLPFQAYAANSTSRLIHFTEYENKIVVISKANGIKAAIPPTNGLYPNIELFESLVFDFRLKAYQSTPTLLIGLNYFQADYSLALNTTYLSQWVQYIIPISFFNWHNYSAALAQLIFYSANYIAYEIKNIYVADYKNITAILSNAQNSTTQYEQSTQSKLGTITAFTNQSYTSQPNWQNITTWANHSYSLICINNTGFQVSQHIENKTATITSWNNISSNQLETNFNITGFTSQNVTITNNQTVRLVLMSDVTYYYPFASNANDVIDSNDGTVHSATLTTDRLNNANAAYNFSAVASQYISLATLPLSGDQEFTIAAWVVTSTTGTRKQIISIGNEILSQAIWLYVNTGNYLAADISGYAGPTSAATITDGNWHYIAIVKTGSGTSTTLQLYVDGSASGSPATMINGLYINNEFKNIGRGSIGYGHDWYWNGKIDDVMIWHEALSSSDISFCYNAGIYAHNAYYQSRVYNLGSATVFYYNTLNFNRIVLCNTTSIVQYRVSADNVTWQSWSAGYNSNQTIGMAKNKYYQFRLNLTSPTGFYSAKNEFVNLTYTKATALYEINETNYTNFTYINKPNVNAITLDAFVIDPLTLYDSFSNNGALQSFGLWGRDTGAAYENGTHCILNTTDCTDYYSGIINEPFLEFRQTQFIYSNSDAQAIYTIGYTNSFSAQWRVVFQFNNDGKLYYIIYKLGLSGYSGLIDTLTNQSTHDLKLAYFENGTFAFYFDGALEYSVTDATYANPTPEYRYIWLDIQGYGAANPTNRLFINSVLNYMTFTNLSYTLKFWNFSSSSYTQFTFYDDLVDYSLSKDYFNATTIQIQFFMNDSSSFSRNLKFSIEISYFSYTNVTFTYYYALPSATFYYFYQFSLNSTPQGQTATYFKWRTSIDNSTWDSWSSATTINLFKNRYLNYQINCNTTWAYNYSKFNAANLQYSKQSLLCYYIILNYTTNFIAPTFLKNITLNANRLSNINNLLNSSLNIYKFSTSTWQNISAINALCQFNVSNNYYNSTKYVRLQVKIYASQSFTFQFKQVELWRYDFLYNKTCYLSANFTLNQIDLHLFYSTFNAPNNQSLIYLYLYNSSTQIKYTVKLAGNTNLTTTLILLADTTLVKLKLKFVYYNALSDTNVTALITRYFFVYNQTYRLFCDANRQASDFITFTQDLQTLCLTDYFGTIIYKHLFNRTTQGYFLDVQLNFFQVTFSNYVPNSTVTFSLTNRHLTINLTLDYGMSMAIPLFTDDYLVVLFHTENKTVINVWDLTISAIRNQKFAYNVTIPMKPVTYGPDYGWMYYLLLIPAFLLLVIAYQQIKKRKGLPKKAKKAITIEATHLNKKKKLKKQKKQKKKNELYV